MRVRRAAAVPLVALTLALQGCSSAVNGAGPAGSTGPGAPVSNTQTVPTPTAPLTPNLTEPQMGKLPPISAFQPNMQIDFAAGIITPDCDGLRTTIQMGYGLSLMIFNGDLQNGNPTAASNSRIAVQLIGDGSIRPAQVKNGRVDIGAVFGLVGAKQAGVAGKDEPDPFADYRPLNAVPVTGTEIYDATGLTDGDALVLKLGLDLGPIGADVTKGVAVGRYKQDGIGVASMATAHDQLEQRIEGDDQCRTPGRPTPTAAQTI